MLTFTAPLPVLPSQSDTLFRRACSFHGAKSPRLSRARPRASVSTTIMLSMGQESESQEPTQGEEPNAEQKSRFERSDDGSRDVEFDVGEEGEGNELFEFVRKVAPPDLVARFSKNAPKVVQNAIRHTLMNMLGSLPPVAFSASVETVAANLVQLLHSSLVTGYMMRNAQYRMSLTRTLAATELKSLPGTMVREPEIQGGVAIFRNGDGTKTEMPIDEYVNELKNTVSKLQKDLERERKGGNELLSYVATMDQKNIEALTKNAGEEVVSAMKSVIRAVTKSQKIPLKPDAVVQASSFELSQLLFYLMVTGYFLREAEVRIELQRNLGGSGPMALDKLLEGDKA
eukprot:Plantae.Rhodophyta-Hildenbrandia_rubra.ctg871.p1 GENE.Plantae.Rhodophyta-Hildenbrandia_rubra.ctg871~~Plantae.Rhodophyta-Hildenbrandia_rubra.ctg871.p1  ORF type:complete len:343 (-),score=63.56 Plantae.Rhodophyta-Hildenbrandia_rubra.ctg871:2945-3973(-)